MFGIGVDFDVEYDDGVEVIYVFFCYVEEFGVIFVEFNVFDGGGEVLCFEEFVGFDFLEVDGVVGGVGGDDGGGWVDVNGLDGILVVLICVEMFVVVCKLGVDVLIFGGREEKIVFVVVFSKREKVLDRRRFWFYWLV